MKHIFDKTNIMLISLLLILIIIFFIGINNLKYNDSTNKYFTSALVNPKYSSQIMRIDFDKKFSLNKLNNNWYIIIDKKKYPADNQKIEEMIKNFTKTIKMYKKTYKNPSKFDNCILFYTSLDILSTSQSVSFINFGSSDFTNSKIEILNMKNNESFQIENLYSDYINADYEFFIRKDFFSQDVTKEFSSIQKITIQNYTDNTSKVFVKSNKMQDDFYKKLNQIILLRSDDLQLNQYEKLLNTKPIAKVTLELGNTTTNSFNIYKFDNSYFVITQDKLVFGISDWTFNRTVELL